MNINNEKRDQDSRSGTRYLIFFNEKSKLDLLIYGLNGVKWKCSRFKYRKNKTRQWN